MIDWLKEISKVIIRVKKMFLLRTESGRNLFSFGDDYNGYTFDKSNLDNSSIVYSFGIGEDLTFSEMIIQECGCKVHAFDPTPKSIKYVQNHKLYNEDKFNFYPIGLADYDGITEFHLPVNDEYVSGSMEKWDGVRDDSIEVEVRKLQTIMDDLGHKKIDLLKMDIEGAEFDVFDDIIKSGIVVKQICVEIHERFFENGYALLKQMIKNLKKAGYTLIARNNDDLTFLKP